MVSQDKGKYEKHNYGDYSGINHDGVFINEQRMKIKVQSNLFYY